MTGYRTIVFNVLIAVFGLIRVFAPDIIPPSDIQINEFLDAVDKVLFSGAVIGNVLLRFFTSTPIFKSKSNCS